MISIALQVGTALACVIVVLRTEPMLNRMHRGTQLIVRLAFFQIAVSAGAELLSISAFAHVPNWREALLAGGIAGLMMCERRLRYLARIRKKS